MTSQQRKDFLSYQQGELDAVLMYKNFAEMTDDPILKEAFLEAAKDEGKHANILSQFTRRKLRPDPTLANITKKAFKILPKRLILLGISFGEYQGGKGYAPYADIPEIKGIIDDEYRHGDTFKALSKKV
ncbi:MAG: hypothetical protein IJ851_04275 [Eubacterium sp.]|nr:hypothetical protein [Eubacterium sp.]